MKKEDIQNLISQMTLEEKAGLCSGADFWHLKGVERLGIPSVMVKMCIRDSTRTACIRTGSIITFIR